MVKSINYCVIKIIDWFIMNILLYIADLDYSPSRTIISYLSTSTSICMILTDVLGIIHEIIQASKNFALVLSSFILFYFLRLIRIVKNNTFLQMDGVFFCLVCSLCNAVLCFLVSPCVTPGILINAISFAKIRGEAFLYLQLLCHVLRSEGLALTLRL